MNHIDINLYSRQIFTLGMDAMKKLTNLNVFIFGLDGLGVEISKNIILAGPKKVIIFDDTIVSLKDLGTNFYLEKNDIINKRRDEACFEKLKENNPYVDVEISESFNKSLNESHIVVITKILKLKELYEINDFCRKNKKGFIYTGLYGLSTFLFVDFGENHIIFDKNGNEKKIFNIKNISRLNEDRLLVSIDVGDYIINDEEVYLFKNIEGSIELNGKDFKIHNYDPYNLTFEIYYDKNINEYKRGGVIEELKIPIHKNYKSLKDTFYEPFGDEIDETKINRNPLIHSFIISLHHFFDKYNTLPELNNDEQAEEIFIEANKIFNLYKNNKFFKKGQKYFEKENIMIKYLSKFSNCQLISLCSFLGGIVSSEIIKFTGIYQPLNQYMWMDNLDSIKYIKNINNLAINSRYDNQISIFGLDLHKAITKLKVFIIGAGALGCEFLKIFAMMGIGSDKEGKIVVTDYDNIEKSNLNRQFLFNYNDIGKSKSKCACNSIKKMNPEINCIDFQLMVNKETENIFNENFWKNLDLVVLAVDNREARKYVDHKCTIYKKKLIECGTLGVKASSHIFIPYITGCYNDIPYSNEQKEIPMCTLKLFPSNIDHCIEWAKNNFYECFINDINDTLLFLKNNDCFDNLSKPIEILNKFEIINEIISILLDNNKFDKCIDYGMKKYYNYFVDAIENIIEDKPENFLDENGNLFWIGNKKFPHIINFNNNNEFCVNFIYHFSFIIAKILNIELINNKILDYIKNYTKNYINKKKIKLNENEINDKLILIKSEINEKIKKIKNDGSIKNIQPEEFEKDNDNNHHIDFIYNCANLRAQNYNILISEREIIKQKAGKIVPAMATTTASICGFLSSQIYPLLAPEIDRLYLKDIILCLSTPYFSLIRPIRMEKFKNYKVDDIECYIIPEGFSVWDSIEIEGSLTVNKFKEIFKEKYNVDIYGFYNLELDALDFDNEENLIEVNYYLQYKIPKENNNIFENNNKEEKEEMINIYFIIDGFLNDENPVKMPVIKYKFNKRKLEENIFKIEESKILDKEKDNSTTENDKSDSQEKGNEEKYDNSNNYDNNSNENSYDNNNIDSNNNNNSYANNNFFNNEDSIKNMEKKQNFGQNSEKGKNDKKDQEIEIIDQEDPENSNKTREYIEKEINENINNIENNKNIINNYEIKEKEEIENDKIIVNNNQNNDCEIINQNEEYIQNNCNNNINEIDKENKNEILELEEKDDNNLEDINEDEYNNYDYLIQKNPVSNKYGCVGIYNL